MKPWFDKNNLFTPWRRRAILTVLALAVPIIGYGAFKALETNANRVQDWLPESFEETRQLYWFTSRFGSGEILVISWDGCTLGDRRAIDLAASLREARHPESGASLFRAVHTGAEMIRRLGEAPLNLAPEAAWRRTLGWLVGPDGRTTAVLALVSREGAADRHAVVEAVYREAEETLGLKPEALYVGGSTVDSVAIDNAAKANMVWLNLGAFSLCILLTFLCFRNWRVALLIFQTALLAEMLSLANLYYTGVYMDSVSLLMASVVYVLSISAAVHLVNYYRESVVQQGEDGAPERAVRHALTPCFLATFTTVIGLGSLAASQIVPISKFGFYSAAAMLMAFVIVFLFVPTVLKGRPIRNEAFLRGGRIDQHIARWGPLHGLISRAYVPLLAATLLVLIFGGIGLSKIRTTVRLHDMFPKSAKIIRDYNWLEKHVGALVPLEVVIRMPSGQDKPMLERMQLVDETSDQIAQLDGVGAVINAGTFLPYMPDRTTPGAGSAVLRAMLRRRLEESRDEIQATGYLRHDDGEQLWRISVRVAAHENVDFERLLEQLHRRVEPILRDAESRGFHELSAVYSGGIPLVHKAQRQLLTDLIFSYLTALGLIGLCMMTVFWIALVRRDGFRRGTLLRGAAAGLLAMIPNMFPMVLVFGIMGWIGQPIEIGIMMTASVALGIAVDDTLHFVTWFQRGIGRGLSRGEAVMFAFQHCGAAMIQTSIICGLGLLIFAFSPFVPISSFSYLMFVLLGAALVGDLLVLPALLISPWGAVLEPRREP